MIETKHPLSATFAPLGTNGAEAPWAGRKLSGSTVVRGKRVLLVEDQELVRSALRMMLDLDGHRVTEASNGVEALKLFTIDEFDIVITDYEMPVMAGNKLAMGVKLLAPSLPVLMITASEQARGDVANPVDALLNKPLTVSELRGALGRLLPAEPEPTEPTVDPAIESPTVTFAGGAQMVAQLQA